MFKKIFITALVVGAGIFILKSTHLGAYARTAIQKTRTYLKKEVPLEFQLETARNEVAQLLPDLKKNISMVAAKDVEVQNLREEVGRLEARLDEGKTRIRAMRAAIKGDTAKVSWNDRTYTVQQFSDRLSRELNVSQRLGKEVEAKKSLLDSEEKCLETAREQLAGMRHVKEQLETEIAKLDNEVRTLRMSQARSTVQLDDSRLSRIKSMLQDVRDRIRVGQTELDYAVKYGFESAPAAAEKKPVHTTAELIKEVDEFLGDAGQQHLVTKP